MTRFSLCSFLNRSFQILFCSVIFAGFSTTTISLAPAAMPQLKFDKRAPGNKIQGSIPKKKVGVGYPSPYSSNSSRSLQRSSSQYGNSHSGHSHSSSNNSSHRGHNHSSYSNNRTGSIRLGNSIFLSVPSRSYGYPRTNSSYYRPTLGVYGSSTNFSTYGNYGQYQPYSIPNSGVPLNYSNVYPPGYPTPSLRPTAPVLSVESEARTRSSYKPKTISNQFYAQIATSASARSFQTRAEQAFKNSQYLEAADLARLALSQDPNNSRLKLFNSHANFAIGNFTQSADYLDQATLSSTSDQWGFVVRNYRKFYGKNDYVSQTDRLSRQIATNPNANALAIRGYHYGSLGYADAATSDFQQALAYDPNNALARRLLPVLGNAVVPVSPEDIQAPVPGGANGVVPTGEFQSRRPADGIIRLVPQLSESDIVESVPVDNGQSILINGPTN